MEDYQKYRWFYTSSGVLVVGGKNALQNDDLINELKKTGKDYLVMHTVAPGSPFACMLKEPKKISITDKIECAVFTAAFSKAWKAKAKKVKVHSFLLSSLSKSKSMKSGTWGVKNKVEVISVDNLKLMLVRQEGVLRAVPVFSTKSKSSVYVLPGELDKQDILAKLEIEYNEPLSREEVLAALPAGGVSIRKK